MLKGTERLLKESEERFRLLYENAPLGYQSLDEDGCFLEVNQAWLDMLGYSRNEVMGKWCGDFLTPPYREKFTSYFPQFKDTGEIHGIEFEMVKKDRSTIFITADGRIGRDRQGQFKQTHCILHDITERKKEQEALDRANREWERTFNAISDLVMVLDDQHRILRANKAMADAVGMTDQELIGKLCFEVVHGQKEPPVFCPHSQLLADSEAHSAEVLEPRLGGTYDVRVSPLVDQNGRVMGSVHVTRDITERKREEAIMQARLRLAEYATSHSLDELLQATLDEVEVLTDSLIGFYHFLDADQRTLRLQAWSTRTLREMCTAEGKGLHYHIDEAGVWVDCVHQRKPVIHNDYSSLPHRRGMPPGHAKVIRELVVPVFRGDRIVAILGVGNKPVDYDARDIETVSLMADLAWDIAERKRADENLRRSEAKFLDLYENAPCAYFSVGTDAVISLCNRRAGELLGYSREELIGKPVFELYADNSEGKEKAGKVFKRFLAGEPIADEELQMQRADGSTVWISLTVNGIRDFDGRLIQSRSMVLDISERRRAEEALRRLNRELRAVSTCNQILLRAVDEQTLVNDICRIICEEAGYRLAWVAYAEDDIAKTLRPVAWAGSHSDYVANAKLTWAHDTERGRGPAGTAIRSGETIYVQDIATDPRMAPWREDALQYGYRSGIALPLKEESAKVFGVLLIYHSQPNAMTSDETRLMEELAGDLAFGINTVRTRAQRERAERELQEANDLLRAIIEAAPTPIFGLDLDGNVQTVWNPAAEKLLGWSAQEVMGRPLPSVPVESQEEFRRFREQIRSGMTLDGMEVLRKRRDGTPINYSIYASPLHDAEGRITGNVAVLVDMTERKQFEAALMESETKYRMLFNAASDAIYILSAEGDERGQIVSANEEAAVMHGYTVPELLTMNIADLDTPDSAAKISERFERLLRGEHLKEITTHRKKDGTVFPIEISARLIEIGGRKYSMAIDRDVTEREKAQTALRKSEERLRTIIDSSPIGIRIVQDGKYIYVNPSFVRMFGYETQDKIVGLPVEALYAPESKDMIIRIEGAKLAGKLTSGHYEAIGLTQNGRIFEMEVWRTAIEYLERRSSLAFIVDVSESKSLRSQLFQAQKMESIGTLAGGIAHDFNNLLQVILGYTEILMLRKGKESPDLPNLEAIRKAAKDGGDLVKGLLLFSRQVESNLRPCDLNIELQHVEPILKRTIPKMIEVELILAEGLRPVNADPIQIEQIVLNISINAQHAMHKSGKLTLETANVTLDDDYCRMYAEAKPGDYVLLKISDTGHGMEEEVLDHIFEPFFTTKKTGEGTGLGLSIVYGIVKSHNGHLTCASQPGQGTSFSIYFPALLLESEMDMARTLGEMPALGTETILVVDDEQAVRDIVEGLLKERGYKLFLAESGEKALGIYREKKEEIDIVVLDLNMPGMGGSECLKEIVKIDPNARVLVVSGHSANQVRKQIMDNGARELVAKPFEGKDLLRAIRRVLEEPGLRDSQVSGSGPASVTIDEGDGTPATARRAGREAPDKENLPRRLSILAIDDREPYLRILEAGLGQDGHTPLTASSGIEGLRIFREMPVDAVVCDLEMPDIDGWEVGRRIKEICQEKGVPKTPFVLLTGQADMEDIDQDDAERMAECGVDAILGKPVDIPEILKVAERLMRKVSDLEPTG
jgi:PAS domain S-box-containing protein